MRPPRAAYRVLSSRPSEAETRFSFAGLTDLLGNAAGDVLPELPPIQRRALEAALLLGESEVHADDRAVAAAFLGALRLLADDGPLCLAVDDVQWLDAASLAALRYALARLDREPVAALLAVRGDVPAWLRRAVPEDRLRTVEVGGLSVGAIHELLRARLDATFPRPTLIRIWETSRGNPFFALELASALQRKGGTLAPGEELPIPVRPRRAPARAGRRPRRRGARGRARRRGARRPDRGARRSGRSAPASTLGSPRRSTRRILELDGNACGSPIRCSLLQSPHARRPRAAASLHARLADLVPSAEERARHLALATAGPDCGVAAFLEEAARTAHARGAPTAAAELAEQALQAHACRRARTTRGGASSSPPTCTTAPGTAPGQSALLERARAVGRAGQRAGHRPDPSGRRPAEPAGRRSRSTARRCRKLTATTRSKPRSTSASPS